MGRRNYRLADIKLLFAHSDNQCAMDECTAKLTSREWKTVLAEIAHIRAHSPGGPRYDWSYKEVDGFDNLLLLCRNCHARIDDLEPQAWPISRLEEMKARHESGANRDHPWAEPWDIFWAANQLLEPAREERSTTISDVELAGRRRVWLGSRRETTNLPSLVDSNRFREALEPFNADEGEDRTRGPSSMLDLLHKERRPGVVEEYPSSP